MKKPVLSICIPTYNRSRYLNRLLPALFSELENFPHETEIIISDNFSTDKTQEVISEYLTKLTLKYFRHESNCGAYANYMFALSKGCGQFLLYLADDDFINFPELDLAVKKLLTNPNLAAVYAPWILYNLVENKSQRQFYTQQNDILINKDNHLLLIETVLSLRVFPEIAVFRRVCWENVAQKTPNLAYWAFVFSSLYVSAGDVLFSCRPFYVSITKYFHDDSRSQLGTEEAENIWDVYRGGLEFMLSRAVRMINREKHLALLGLINDFISERMSTALRLKIGNARSDIDIYYLACRLNGLGYNHLLPTNMYVLSLRATLFFISTDHHQFKEPPKLLCHESLNNQDYNQIKLISRNRASRLLVNSEAKFCAIIFQSRNILNEFYLNKIQNDHCRILIVDELRFKFPWF
jgi:glycosyltransferase involved in cell wall biosynthesis